MLLALIILRRKKFSPKKYVLRQDIIKHSYSKTEIFGFALRLVTFFMDNLKCVQCYTTMSWRYILYVRNFNTHVCSPYIYKLYGQICFKKQQVLYNDECLGQNKFHNQVLLSFYSVAI